MADETIGAAERRIDSGADADETSRDGEFQVVAFGEEGDDAGEDGRALGFALFVGPDDAGADLDLVAEFEDPGKNTSACDATLEVLDPGAWFVDVEGADDDHAGGVFEVSDGDGDFVDELFDDCVDVVFQLGGDGDDRGTVGGGAADEFEDGFVVICRPFFSH